MKVERIERGDPQRWWDHEMDACMRVEATHSEAVRIAALRAVVKELARVFSENSQSVSCFCEIRYRIGGCVLDPETRFTRIAGSGTVIPTFPAL